MAEEASAPAEWFIDETVVETRLARRIDGALIDIRHFPRLAPELLRARVGDLYLVRVMKAAPAMKGAFVALGVAGDGFLRLREAVPEGALIGALVVQSAYGSKLAVLAPHEIPAGLSPSREAVPCRVREAPGAAELALAGLKSGERLLIDGDDALKKVRQLAAKNSGSGSIEEAKPGLFEREGIEAEIEQALEAVVPLAGGRLIIEETHALAAIDVDLRPEARAAAVNLEAAKRIPIEIARRRLAGAIVIGFARIARASELERLAECLAAQSGRIGLKLDLGVRSRTGLLECQVPRGEASLAALLTKAGVTHSSIVPALNNAAQSAALARAVRRAVAARPGAHIVRVAPALGEWLLRPQGPWAAIASAFPAPLELKVEESLQPGRFEIEGRGRRQ